VTTYTKDIVKWYDVFGSHCIQEARVYKLAACIVLTGMITDFAVYNKQKWDEINRILYGNNSEFVVMTIGWHRRAQSVYLCRRFVVVV